jgi:hypothetical protein
VNDQLQASELLPRGKSPKYLLVSGLDGPHSRSWGSREEKNSTSDGDPQQVVKLIRCGHVVSGIILLRDLTGAMQLELGKEISVHIPPCTSYDLNALTPVVCKLWR